MEIYISFCFFSFLFVSFCFFCKVVSEGYISNAFCHISLGAAHCWAPVRLLWEAVVSPKVGLALGQIFEFATTNLFVRSFGQPSVGYQTLERLLEEEQPERSKENPREAGERT